jgi:FAD/FMN-containing dehydrogenase/Fe-S oxidoreductase
MNNHNIKGFISALRNQFQGEICEDELHKIMYSTDASAYREKPALVCFPANKDDLKKLIIEASKFDISLIFRTAGTSLAGQVVGSGVVVDVSKHFTQIKKIDVNQKRVTIEPGVILDELNMEVKKHGLFFGPETSTGNRCMIGGMIGNNSCGAHSLIYGSTRDHLLSVDVILSDGSEVTFSEICNQEFEAKCKLNTLEGKIYSQIRDTLSNPQIQKNIRDEYPDKEIERRNTGYAIDLLLETQPFTKNGSKFNMAKLIAGSEGTLACITSATLNLIDVPPPHAALVCVHLQNVEESLRANIVALEFAPASVELMDGKILDLTRENPTQNKNRFFVQGNPGAILIVEFMGHTQIDIEKITKSMVNSLKEQNLGYHFPVIWGQDMKKVWDLRKAGLGVLSNMPGDAKPVPVIEDTAVAPRKLPQYIHDFNHLLKEYELECVYYAHIGTGELHLRPVINLKEEKGVELFRTIAHETALLVKKYGGSLSGEHGDGRLRGEFIQLMIGEENFQLLKELKKTWDPKGIFNRDKITNTPQMNTFLRYEPGKPTKDIETIFDFSTDGGIIRSVEKCNGSADCRRTHLSGGTMCPSYMGTLNEQHTTRARANVLREILTNSTKVNPFDHNELYEVLDLCLSCKACKSECPSNVDMTKYKTEFLQHWYDAHGVPRRAKAIGHIAKLNRVGMIAPSLYNMMFQTPFFARILQSLIGFSKKRNLPRLPQKTLRKQAEKFLKSNKPSSQTQKGELVLFVDEFSNYQDAHIGMAVVELLTKLNYRVHIIPHEVSGRTYLSKGLLRKAKSIAKKNIEIFSKIVHEDCPLIGIEPSAILGFRDEYLSLCGDHLQKQAKHLAKNAFLLEEFIVREYEKGKILTEDFSQFSAHIKLHGHCHQKAIADTSVLKRMLEIPAHFNVTEIQSGCCGMAGAFGYEKEHYEVSMRIGELVLFPQVRNAPEEMYIVAPGTSCREQMKDGTGRQAIHPAQMLLYALTHS